MPRFHTSGISKNHSRARDCPWSGVWDKKVGKLSEFLAHRILYHEPCDHRGYLGEYPTRWPYSGIRLADPRHSRRSDFYPTSPLLGRPPKAASGHEDRFRPQSLSGRSAFG